LRPGIELLSYKQVRRNPTERNIDELATDADIVINTGRSTTDDVIVRAASRLGLLANSREPLVDVVVGGQYGSEGKGNIAYHLSIDYGLLVRTGGPNAGHKVYTDSGTYTHHHLPSGTRRGQARLLLGPGAVLSVKDLLDEISECSVDVDRLSIDPQAMIISDRDRNREKRLVSSIGSTGQGVGAATARRILDRSLPAPLARDVPALRPYLRPAQEVLDESFARRERVLLEGTQGTALSLFHGYYPHVTSRDTTVGGCLAEAGIAPSAVKRIVMVCRTYPIRVQSPPGGTSGFMSQPISWAEIARRSGLDIHLLRQTERTSTTNRGRRVAEFDWALLRRASALNGPTDIALTFVDYLSAENAEARRFDQLTDDTIRFIEEVENVAAAPVSLLSVGFHTRSIIDRRSW